MNETSHPTRTIISLGGSIFIPDEIDVNFLKSFIELIKARVAKGEHFAIIVGGGKICRKYQQASRELGDRTEIDLDWIGIYVTRLNAQFFRIVFGDLAHDDIVLDPRDTEHVAKPVLIGAGWEPGWSTDYDAVLMADKLRAKRLLNLSNTSHVFDKDPRTNPEAKPFNELTWDQYRALIPAEWTSGLSTPFDPIASKLAQTNGLEVMILNGTKLSDVEKCLDGQPFDGTVIRG